MAKDLTSCVVINRGMQMRPPWNLMDVGDYFDISCVQSWRHAQNSIHKLQASAQRHNHGITPNCTYSHERATPTTVRTTRLT